MEKEGESATVISDVTCVVGSFRQAVYHEAPNVAVARHS